MASKKVTELTEVSVPSLSDYTYVVDVSDTADNPAGTSYKMSLSYLLGCFNQTCQGRLTLSAGNPVYNPLPSTPSSTDTSADTCTFSSAHGWTTGTMVTPDSTGGGLTAGTTYYINAVSTTVVSFHTTLANAEAGSSKVDLTGSVSSQINPFGVQSTTVRFSPYNGNLISVYNGSTWAMFTFSELSLVLGSVTSGLPYDIFVYSNSGTLTLEKVAWSSATVRTTDLTTQDSVYVKSGDTTRRYLGTIYTVSTSATEDSQGGVVTQVGGKRFVWNMYNRVLQNLIVLDMSTTWSYGTATWRAANGSNGNRIELVTGSIGNQVTAQLTVCVVVTIQIDARDAQQAIAEDSTTAPATLATGRYCVLYSRVAQNLSVGNQGESFLEKPVPLGYHYYQWIEMASLGKAYNAYGYPGEHVRSGMSAMWEC